MRPIREWHHWYVELHARFWEDDAGFNCPVRVPKWYAKLWGYPDSSWQGPRYKSSGYHIGHWTAVLSIIAPLTYLIV